MKELATGLLGPWWRWILGGLVVAILGVAVWIYASEASRKRAGEELLRFGFASPTPQSCLLQSELGLVLQKLRGVFSRGTEERTLFLMDERRDSLEPVSWALKRFEPTVVEFDECLNLRDVTPLGSAPQIKEAVFIKCPKLGDLSCFLKVSQLRKLHLNGMPALARIPKNAAPHLLSELHVSECTAVSDFSALQDFSALSYLTLRDLPNLKNADDFRQLSGLDVLILGNCSNLSDIRGLHGLKGLSQIFLFNCPLLKKADIDALQAALPSASIEASEL